MQIQECFWEYRKSTPKNLSKHIEQLFIYKSHKQKAVNQKINCFFIPFGYYKLFTVNNSFEFFTS